MPVILWLFFPDRNDDALGRTYRAYARKVRRMLLIAVLAMGAVCYLGLPHVQSGYKFTGPRGPYGTPASGQKIEAWYLSVTGWQNVQRGDFGRDNLPVVMCIPITTCIDFEALKTRVLTYVPF